jgi:hypothetical protein
VKTFWRRTSFPIICFLMAMVLALTGQLFNDTWLTAAFWTLAVFPFAVAFYRMRDVNRLIYGAFELLIALASLYVGIWRFASTPSPMSFDHVATVWLFLWVAIYFMVRALENIGVGLRGSKYKMRWDAVFHPGKQDGAKA